MRDRCGSRGEQGSLVGRGNSGEATTDGDVSAVTAREEGVRGVM